VFAVLDALPRLLAAKDPEAWGMKLVPMIAAFRLVFGPLSWGIDRSLRSIVRTADELDADETEEILRSAEIETDDDVIEEDEREMIRSIVQLEETYARESMAPRIDIVGLDVSETLDDALKLVVARGFSRIPLYDETIDNVVGIVYAKDLLRCVTEGRHPDLREIARPAYFIPESKRVDELLAELRKSKVHIAIVVDEYGGTAGLVTIEDLLEEIVGEIQDEYDREEAPIERVTDTEAIIDARVSIDALRELFGFEMEDEDYDTVGGFVYHHLGKVPVAGDEVRVDGLTLRVLSVLGRRIKKVRATKASAPDGAVAS
jgi:CBS domain containing-hemolysin-like protein